MDVGLCVDRCVVVCAVILVSHEFRIGSQWVMYWGRLWSLMLSWVNSRCALQFQFLSWVLTEFSWWLVGGLVHSLGVLEC